jgi:hypothetical protein
MDAFSRSPIACTITITAVKAQDGVEGGEMHVVDRVVVA